jgi:hypothetical protein
MFSRCHMFCVLLWCVCCMLSYAMIRSAVLCYAMVWYGTLWHGMVLYVMVWYGTLCWVLCFALSSHDGFVARNLFHSHFSLAADAHAAVCCAPLAGPGGGGRREDGAERWPRRVGRVAPCVCARGRGGGTAANTRRTCAAQGASAVCGRVREWNACTGLWPRGRASLLARGWSARRADRCHASAFPTLHCLTVPLRRLAAVMMVTAPRCCTRQR